MSCCKIYFSIAIYKDAKRLRKTESFDSKVITIGFEASILTYKSYFLQTADDFDSNKNDFAILISQQAIHLQFNILILKKRNSINLLKIIIMKTKFITLLFVSFIAIANSYAANRYWVGGATGTWNSTTASWSDVSGGAPGSFVPTASDIAVFESGAAITALTLESAVRVNSITFTSRNVTFAGAFAITTTNMTLDNSQVVFANAVTINSALTFSGTTTAPRLTGGKGALILGNGGAFTLTGNSATNYFDGGVNCSFRYNTTSALTVFFKPNLSMYNITLFKGLITLGNNVIINRVGFQAASLNNQELILAPNVTLTIPGGATSEFTALAGGGTINASASGSKVLITSTAASVIATTGRIFKENTTINHLEVNTTGNLVLGFPIKVLKLTKTAGTITTTSTNTISIAAGGSVVEGAGTISGPDVIIKR